MWGRMRSCAPVGNRCWHPFALKQAGSQPAAGCQPAPHSGVIIQRNSPIGFGPVDANSIATNPPGGKCTISLVDPSTHATVAESSGSWETTSTESAPCVRISFHRSAGVDSGRNASASESDSSKSSSCAASRAVSVARKYGLARTDSGFTCACLREANTRRNSSLPLSVNFRPRSPSEDWRSAIP